MILASLGIYGVVSYSVNQPRAATFGATALILTVVALAAGYIPSLRASRIDPMRALRAE